MVNWAAAKGLLSALYKLKHKKKLLEEKTSLTQRKYCLLKFILLHILEPFESNEVFLWGDEVLNP